MIQKQKKSAPDYHEYETKTTDFDFSLHFRMLKSLIDTKTLMSESAAFLLSKNPATEKFEDDKYVFNVDETRESHDSLPDKTVITITSSPM
jgi:hypothetical protein